MLRRECVMGLIISVAGTVSEVVTSMVKSGHGDGEVVEGEL